MQEAPFLCIEKPIAALPAYQQIRASNLSKFNEFIGARGGCAVTLMERFGLDPGMIVNEDKFIDGDKLVNLLEHCREKFDDSLFALRLARTQGPDVFGSVTALCRSAKTFEEALRCKIEYVRLSYAPQSRLELVQGTQIAEVRWQSSRSEQPQDQIFYQSALLNLKFLQMLGGGRFKPDYVTLTTDTRAADIDELEKTFQCEFRHNGDVNAIAFPAHFLAQGLPGSDRVVFQLLKTYFDRSKSVCRDSVLERVEDYISTDLSSGLCSIERCAEHLDYPVRTLQAHLGELGTSFSDLVRIERITTAKASLAREELSLDEIAYMLGYSEQGAFGRAFRRWTGTTPHAFRTALRKRRKFASIAPGQSAPIVKIHA